MNKEGKKMNINANAVAVRPSYSPINQENIRLAAISNITICINMQKNA